MTLSQIPIFVDRIKHLQDFLHTSEANAIIIPQADRFQAEYPPLCDERLAWLTGFTGSNGIAIVTKYQVCLLTDGRYILQAGEETENTGIEVQNLNNLGNVIKNTLQKDYIVLFDPWLHTPHSLKIWFDLSEKIGFHLRHLAENPIDLFWKNKPPKPQGKIWPHAIEWAGEDAIDKQEKICDFLKEKKFDALFLRSPECTAWLLNIRGSDGRFTPTAQMFSFIQKDGTIYVYTDLNKLNDAVRQHCGSHVFWFEEEQLLEGLSLLAEKSVLVDKQYIPQKVIHRLSEVNAKIHLGQDPCIPFKAIKNTTEVTGAYACHKRDAIALIHFLSWLEDSIARQEPITELQAAQQLLVFRKQQEYFFSQSFAPISSSGAHGAVVHYTPSIETDCIIDKDSLYLIDSGGQYFDGTTDVTRTICFTPPTDEQKDRFTRVLKGHIAIATALFPDGTVGHALDTLARQFLWKAGVDYEHGTGHGVGSFLGVHEGPQNIGKSISTAPLKPGMILSNEPGYYKAGEYGIRIESLVVVVKKIDEPNRQFFGFDTVTLVPIDRKLIDITMLTDEEVTWLDSYHHRIWKTLSPLLSGHTFDWLQKETQPLIR